MAIPQCYCLLNSSICASDISRLAPPRPIKIFVLFFLLVLIMFGFFFPLDAMIDGVPINLHRAPCQTSPSRCGATGHGTGFHPGLALARVSCPASGMPHSLFTSSCGNISHQGPGQEWKTIPSLQLSSLGRHSWCRWQHSPIFSLCWAGGFSAKEDVVEGSHPVGASDTFQLLLFSFG